MTSQPQQISVLVGEMSNGSRRMEWVRDLGWGRCFVERPVKPYAGEPWCLDNGAWSAWKNSTGDRFGTKGLLMDEEREWITRVCRRFHRAYRDGHEPLFAVLPDAPHAGEFSLDLTLEWSRELRQMFPRWRWYVAVQDGLTPATLAPFLAEFDGVFLGGSHAWKDATAASWARWAHNLGLGAHYGRCSTPARLQRAASAGYDSADSAFFLWKDARFVEYALTWADVTHQHERVAAWLRSVPELEPYSVEVA